MPIELGEQIQIAVDILKKGGVVAFPTDTVYGLGANIMQENALKRIFLIKRRNQTSPLPVLLADIIQLEQVLSPVTHLAYCLGNHFWPGAVTIIGYKSSLISDTITAGGDTVGVRIPDHAIPIALIKGLGFPITGTSANISGESSMTTAQEIRQHLGNDVDYIIDDGIGCPGGMASTIVDATTDEPRIIREGAVSTQNILTVCALAAKEK